MRERGLDLTRHEAQPLTDQLVRHADLILTMTQSHLQSIVERWPHAADRAFLLLPERNDVADPIGRNEGIYRQVCDQIEGLVMQLVLELRNGARAQPGSRGPRAI